MSASLSETEVASCSPAAAADNLYADNMITSSPNSAVVDTLEISATDLDIAVTTNSDNMLASTPNSAVGLLENDEISTKYKIKQCMKEFLASATSMYQYQFEMLKKELEILIEFLLCS